MNQTQKRYAIQRLCDKSTARVESMIEQRKLQLSEINSMSTLKVRDLLNLTPKTNFTDEELDTVATIDNLFDLTEIRAAIDSNIKEMKKTLGTAANDYFELIHPVTGKVILRKYMSKELQVPVKNLQTKLNNCADAIMLGDAEEAQAAINNF